MAVMLPFRQLYSKGSADDLFNRCCKIHSRHCPEGHHAVWWVAYYKTQFNELLEQPVELPWCKTDVPGRRYLDAFAYGTRAVHASAKKSAPANDLNDLWTAHPRAMVMMGYHSILKRLLGHLSMVMPILTQNVTHWVNDLGWADGGALRGRDLFAPRVSRGGGWHAYCQL